MIPTSTDHGVQRVPLALLQLLAPAGAAARTLVLGPAHSSGGGADTIDLLVLVDGDRIQDSTAWRAAAAAAAARLAEDGVVYVYARPRTRRRLLRLLDGAGVRARTAFVHIRGPESHDLLVELDQRALTYALGSVTGPRPLLRLLLRRIPRPFWRPVLLVAPRVGVAVRRERSRPLLDWLRPTTPDGGGGAVILRSLARGARQSLFVYRFGTRPLIVKVGARGADDEGRALIGLGPAARRAGAIVPERVPLATTPGAPQAAALTIIDGAPAATTLARRPAAVAAVVVCVADWLERWNLSTASPTIVTDRFLQDELLAHARLLEPRLRGGTEYRSWLERKAEEWSGAVIPLVAAHLDLTMANVLLVGRGKLAVLDWEHARARGLPLGDLFYAAADAAAASGSYRDRVTAFRSCFEPGARWRADVWEQERRLADALEVAPEMRELCFHACWLHHAVNELHAGGDDAAAPFREIVQAVATTVARD
jgi:hypothetical protein